MLLPNTWPASKSSLAAKIPQPIRPLSSARVRKSGLPLRLPLEWSHPTHPVSSISSEAGNLAEFPAAENLPNLSPTPGEIDPLYLLACHVEWEQRGEPSAAWELIGAAQSPNENTRAHARALLDQSRQVNGVSGGTPVADSQKGEFKKEVEVRMKVPYGLEIVDSCTACSFRKPGFFCEFTDPVLKGLSQMSHTLTMPAGAILFVEGQVPRGVYILCTGKVKLSTTSREGKVLMLKTSEAGEPLGLSAVISGTEYEVTAETVVPCQLKYVDRKSVLNLMETQSEVGLHAAQFLSRDFQSAYRDIHELILARSSAGKLAKLILTYSPPPEASANEIPMNGPMTHEEMAQRIGASRETVTRLLSELRRKQLIRLEGPTLIVRNRTALEAMAF